MRQIIIGGAVVDLARREVHRGTRVVRLEPKAADVLKELAAKRGSPIARGALLDLCWATGEGSDEALTQAIAQIRRAIGEDARAQVWIHTIPKRGYCLADASEKTALVGAVDGTHNAGRMSFSIVAVAILCIAAVAILLAALLFLGRDERVIEKRYLPSTRSAAADWTQ